MFYAKWTEQDIKGLESRFGFKVIFTEVNESGHVIREIGIGLAGNISHVWSQATSAQAQAVFDLAVIGKVEDSNISRAEFERLWRDGEPMSSEWPTK